jgi:uncharacterized protein (DUF1697 family)
MKTYIALLRGINVGGRNKLPMADLRELLQELGLQQARTYIQSGNVAFESDRDDLPQLSEEISASINGRFGFEPAVLLMTDETLQTAAEANPFPEAISEPKKLHLYFMAAAPPEPDLQAMQDLAQDGEQFALKDRIFYFYAPEGIGRSKLAAKIEKLLGVPATARNWRSVDSILELATGK